MEISDKQILITGAGGLLGRRLVEAFADKCKLTLHYHTPPEKISDAHIVYGDLSSIDHVKELTKEIKPDIIINAAALADVDQCEYEPEKSREINVKAVKILLKYFKSAKLVHISTDYVFDSNSVGSPDDVPNPVNTYGQHKLEADKLVLKGSAKNLIVRVNTLFDYGPRNNFFKYVYESVHARKKVSAVTDQTSNPISAITSAELIYQLVAKDAAGAFHLGGSEFVTRYEFACRAAEYFGLDVDFVVPVESSSFENRAKRPAVAGLNCDKTEAFLGIKMPTLEQEFAKVKKTM